MLVSTVNCPLRCRCCRDNWIPKRGNFCDCVLWCRSASHHQLCTGFMDTAKRENFLIPLVEMFLFALRKLLPEGFSKFSKLTKL